MFDQYFEFFLENFGQPTSQRFPTIAEVEKYRGVLPDRLLEYWQQIGFAGFKNGLFWIVNPAEYEDILERFLEPTTFPDIDTYHVIARDAWGGLHLWGERTGNSLAITSMCNWMRTKQDSAREIANGEANQRMEVYFALNNPEAEDTNDENSQPMFESALKQYGPLAEDELYGFSPFLFMGGENTVEGLSKENIFVHLNLIADMGDMEVIDMASMINRTLKEHGE